MGIRESTPAIRHLEAIDFGTYFSARSPSVALGLLGRGGRKSWWYNTRKKMFYEFFNFTLFNSDLAWSVTQHTLEITFAL